jgi:hypothetical protein
MIDIRSLDICLFHIHSFLVRVLPTRLSRNCSSRVGAFAFCLSEAGLSRWFTGRRRLTPRHFLWRCPGRSAPAVPHLLVVPFDIPFSLRLRIRPSGPQP